MALNTLRGRYSFKRVMAHGRFTRSNGVRVHYTHNGTDANRYGISATTAVGGAVVRNRVRRWSRELLRKWDCSIAPGHDVVVFVNNKDAQEDFRTFAIHLAHSLRKAQLAESDLRV
ncbi:MAG: ribonuclease P protein component [bacterium]|nr:ribonuclease P protein component [bacterium]